MAAAAFISQMKYVVQAPLLVGAKAEGGNGFRSAGQEDIKQAIREVEKQVEKVAATIIQHCKANHCQFKDPDFGPSDDDEFGAKSLYGNPPAPPGSAGGSKYPPPESLRWDRPQYLTDELAESNGNEAADDAEVTEDDEEGFYGGEFASDNEESDVWCTEGQLFVDGSSSGDVIQGSLGDCWFLGALSVLATQEILLQNTFWKGDKFKEYGFFVLRFFKDTSVCYVFIDDRIPCHDNRSGQPAFARCRDNNELWVPMIEKAYAKLHGSYKALIGGYVHNAIADLTGFPPELLVLKKGHAGFNEAIDEASLWTRLSEYTRWKSLMGCSIQPDPGAERKVEGNAAMGLRMMHAYALLNCLEIKHPALNGGKEIRLVKLRNPWGFGEWTGEWSDRWIEEHEHGEKIKELLSAVEAHDTEKTDFVESDGIFYMRYSDWSRYFSHLFVGVQFPSGANDAWLQSTVQFDWVSNVGGPRTLKTWMSNPRLSFRLQSTSQRKLSATGNLPETARVYIGVRIDDPRLTHGVDYFKTPLYQTPLSFDVISRNKQANLDIPALLTADHRQRVSINNAQSLSDSSPSTSSHQVAQPPYYFGAMQLQLQLQVDEEYLIIPSLYKREQAGRAFFTFASPYPFEIDGRAYQGVEMASVKLNRSDTELSLQQCNERYEALREKLVAEARKRGIKLENVKEAFASAEATLRRHNLKRRLQSLGFSLAEFPDEQFDLLFHMLDTDDSGDVSISEFLNFFEIGAELDREMKQPEPPVDDVMFRPSDLDGKLRVTVNGARALRAPSTWFSNESERRSDPARILHFEIDPTIVQREHQYMHLRVLGPADHKNQERSSQEVGFEPKIRDSMDAPNSAMDGDGDDARSHFGGTRQLKDSNKIKQMQKQVAFKNAQTLHKDKAFRDIEKKRTKMFLNAKEQFMSAMLPSVESQSRPAFKRKVTWHPQRGGRGTLQRRDSSDVIAWLSLAPRDQPTGANVKSSSLINELLEQCWVIIQGRARAHMSRFAIESNSPMVLAGHMSQIQQVSYSRSVTPSTPLKVTKGRAMTARPRHRTPLSRQGGGTGALNASQGLLTQLSSKLEMIKEDEDATQRQPQLVFARLVKIPYQHDGELSQLDKPMSSAELWFRYFDRDGNGVITFQEFKQTMLELRLHLTDEEYRTIFNRFESRVHDGVIDWQEFLAYYKSSKLSTRTPQSRTPVHSTLTLLQRSWETIRDALEQQRISQGLPALPEHEGHSLNCIIFSSLSAQAAQQNLKTLRSLCPTLDMSAETFRRIGVAFNEDIDVLMDFIRGRVGGQQVHGDLEQACDRIIQDVRHAIVTRASAPTASGSENTEPMKTGSTSRTLWEGFARGGSVTVSFDDMASRLEHLLLEHVVGANDFEPVAASSDESAGDVKVETFQKKGDPSNTYMLHKVTTTNTSDDTESSTEWYLAGLPLWVMARVITDHIQSEHWNLQPTKTVAGNHISFPAFEAFIQPQHVCTVEQKLKLLFAQHAEAANGNIYHIVRVSITPDKKLLVLEAHEPISGSLYRMEWSGDYSKLRTIPRQEPQSTMADLIEQLNDTRSSDKTSYGFMQPTYDHLHYPRETYAIVELVSRLRLVHTGTKTELRLGEDRKFLDQLRARCISVDLPFFSFIDELRMWFQTSTQHLTEAGTLEKAIFGAIRARPQLATFLCGTVATLSVILSTYDGHDSIAMSWPEMMAFVAGYKNPLVALELLPPKIEATADAIAQYLVDEESGGNTDEVGGVQRSKVDVDGGTHPNWSSDFTFEFEPSALTLQSVLITDIHKLEIDSKPKYVVVMVRIGADQSLYLTLYDPKSATDYMCTGYDMKQLNQCSTDSSSMEYEVGNWLKEHKASLKLGEPITPRLVLKVFNKRGQTEELLGATELSISTFLKNTGRVSDVATNLTFGEQFDAGQLFLRVSFETQQAKSNNGEGNNTRRRKLSRKPSVKPANGSDAARPAITTSDTGLSSAALTRQLTEAKEHANAMKAENDRLQQLVTSAEAAKQKLTADKHELEARCRELQASSKNPQRENQADRADEYESKIHQLESTIEEMRKQQRDTLNSPPTEQTNDSGTKNNEANSPGFDEVVEELKEAKAESDAAAERLHRDLENANAEIERLKKQLSEANHASQGDNTKLRSADDLISARLRLTEAAQRELKLRDEHSTALDELASLIRAILTSEDGTVPIEDVWNLFGSALGIELTDNEIECLLIALPIKTSGSSLAVEPEAVVQFIKGDKSPTMLANGNAPKPRPPEAATSQNRTTRKAWVQTRQDNGEESPEDEQPPNAASQQSTPVDWNTVALPKGWERRVTDEGREYYLDHQNRVTQWYHPSDPRAQQAKLRKKKKRSA